MPNTMALMSMRYAPWMAWRPRTKRRPSMIERSPGRWPAAGRAAAGRSGARPATPPRSWPRPASTRTGPPPRPAAARPPPGPTTRPNWNRAWKMAFAVGTSDRSDQVRHDGAAPGVVQPAEPGRQGREDEQRPQRGPEVGVDGQARRCSRPSAPAPPSAAGGGPWRRPPSRPAAPGDQREQLGQRDQADVEGRAGQLVHLVGHRHRGQLRAEHGDELARGPAGAGRVSAAAGSDR